MPGGIEINNAMLSLVESTVQRNSVVGETGGILFTTGTFSAVDTVIRDNHGSQGIVAGGMICNGGTATFERVAFIGNSGLHGGALLLEGSGCDATLTNVTLSGNSSNSDGALDNHRGTVTLANVTVTENSNFGLVGAMSVRNTIVAGNGNPGSAQCSGSFTSLGHNVDEREFCGFDQATDLEMIDPELLLGPLDETGSSPVHPLLPGSEAIDAIPVEDCLDSEDLPLLTDQLGVERPQGPSCDIGAVEFVPEPAAIALQVAALVSVGWLARRRRRG
jgi:hypothetical protein